MLRRFQKSSALNPPIHLCVPFMPVMRSQPCSLLTVSKSSPCARLGSTLCRQLVGPRRLKISRPAPMRGNPRCSNKSSPNLIAPNWLRPNASFPVGAAWATARNIVKYLSHWRTNSAPPLVLPARQSMPDLCLTIIKSARPARSSHQNSTLPSAYPARFNTWPA